MCSNRVISGVSGSTSQILRPRSNEHSSRSDWKGIRMANAGNVSKERSSTGKVQKLSNYLPVENLKEPRGNSNYLILFHCEYL